jgi:hypothetical protein
MPNTWSFLKVILDTDYIRQFNPKTAKLGLPHLTRVPNKLNNHKWWQFQKIYTYILPSFLINSLSPPTLKSKSTRKNWISPHFSLLSSSWNTHHDQKLGLSLVHKSWMYSHSTIYYVLMICNHATIHKKTLPEINAESPLENTSCTTFFSDSFWLT